MQSQISDERIDGMLKRAKELAEDEGRELTEDYVRTGIAEINPCGDSYLDQCWMNETDEVRGATKRATYNAEMTERVIERLRALFPAA